MCGREDEVEFARRPPHRVQKVLMLHIKPLVGCVREDVRGAAAELPAVVGALGTFLKRSRSERFDVRAMYGTVEKGGGQEEKTKEKDILQSEK